MDGQHFATTAIGVREAVELKKPHADWLDARGIDPTLAQKFGLFTSQRGGRNWLAVPYYEQGRTVNHKYRVVSEAHAYQMDDNAPLTLWNYDVLLDESLASQPLIVTEGEWDALSILTAGKRRVVSIPNGAPGKVSDDEALTEGKRYQWFWRCEALLAKVKQVILCVDNDEPGRALAADLCRLFGPERCLFVTYPPECKDAGDVVRFHDHTTLVQMLDHAKPYPIKGLYSVSDFPERGEIVAWPTGIDALNDLMQIVPGTLTVFTGYANMGKSTVMNAVLGHLIRHNVPVCVASFETDVKPILRDHLRASIAQCSLHDARNRDMPEVDALIEDNVRIITQLVDEDEEMDLDFFLDLCRTAVLRDGVKFVLLDPWNELEHKRRRDETETDYISRALRAIKRFAKQYQVAFWIVAHPTKPHEGAVKVPGLLNISGSANWANKADYGLTYHRARPDENRAELRVTKVRMGLPGEKGGVDVTFDHRNSTFRKIEHEA
jgi:twinkle protein